MINREIAKALKGLPVPSKFVLAVSGGPDSQCLLKAFPHVARPMGHSMRAVGIDHGLRAEAPAELALAQELAESAGVPFHRMRMPVARGPNLQARARESRYAALRAMLDGPGYVVTAHHADDRAETVIIRLLRGYGAGAMGVLAPVNGDLFRPMVGIRRAEVMAYLVRWGVAYASDPSNMDEKYLRVWVRNKLLPLMAEKSPRIVEKLCTVADDLMQSGPYGPSVRAVQAVTDVLTLDAEEATFGDSETVEYLLQEVDEAVAASVMKE